MKHANSHGELQPVGETFNYCRDPDDCFLNYQNTYNVIECGYWE